MASHRVRSRKSDSEPGSKREISKRGGSTSGSTSGGGNEDHPRMTARRSTTSVFSVFSTAQIQELKEDKKKEKKSKKKDKAAEDAPAEEGGAAEKSEPKRAQRATSNVFALFNQAQIQEFKETFTLIDQNQDGFIDIEDLRSINMSMGCVSIGPWFYPEAFQMMDLNRDGFLDQSDLAGIWQQTGREPESKTLDEMIAESPGQLNFTHFLNLFGEKMHGLSPDDASLKSMLAEAPGPINFTMFLTLFGEKTKGTDPENTLRDAFAMFDSSKSGVLDEQYVKDLLMNTGDPFSKEEIKQTWKEVPIESGKLDYIKFVQYIKRGKEEEM